ncbi:MAG: ABC transporter ATP-binding protein [Patescibacteria group bacterium]
MLKVRDVSLTHHPIQELSDVSLTVGKGEVCALIGPNGGGKELLTQLIADPRWEHSGEIVVNHFNVSHEPDKAKYHLGYASPTIALEPYLTGFEQLDFWGSIFGLSPAERSKRIIDAANTFGLSANLYHLIEVLAQADHQKIRLIASLLHRPSVVIWNEPTEFLDPTEQQGVKEVIDWLRHNKTAVVIASNDLSLVESVADQIAVMVNGKITARGNLTELKNHSRSGSKALPEIYRLLVK